MRQRCEHTPRRNQPRRTLLLTGASRGIGHATVKRFSAAGWRVITCSRHPFPENCPWEMGPEDHIQVDLADPGDTHAAIAEIKQRLDDGELHALVNNAAISPKAEGGKRLASIDTTVDVWHHVFQVNFFAPIMLARGLFEEFKAAKGSVVNVTSIAGSRVHPFAGAAYATSKAALASLTREMAADFGPLGIRVNAIAPGEIDTSILSPGTEEIVHTRFRCSASARPTRSPRSSTCCAPSIVLCERRRDPHQWRPARIIQAPSSDFSFKADCRSGWGPSPNATRRDPSRNFRLVCIRIAVDQRPQEHRVRDAAHLVLDREQVLA